MATPDTTRSFGTLLRTWLGLTEETSNVPPLGTLLHGRYKLLKELGRGAGAVVFLGQDETLEQEVAVKVLLNNGLYQNPQSEALDATLRAEARASMRLTHPNILRVYTYERDRHWEYLVMEVVHGQDLAHYRNQYPDRRMPASEVVSIGLCCLDALSYAHKMGIIHHDIKPANILISHDGAVKLCDFGLARSSLSPVQTGLAIGSPLYMSPERIRGESGDIRSDLYALASTLFSLAHGTAPFGQKAQPAMQGHLEAALPSAEEIPSELYRILSKAMQKNPHDRYNDAVEMRADLATCLLPPVAPAVVIVVPPPPVAPAILPPEPPPTATDVRDPNMLDSLTASGRSRLERQINGGGRPFYTVTPLLHLAPPRPPPAPSGMAYISPRHLQEGHQAHMIQGFFMDLTPVTNQAYQAFLQATGEFPPAHWFGNQPPPKREQHPVVGVSLLQARRYAAWKGQRLPTHAEWLSVVHGDEGRRFPWGNDCHKQNCQCSLSGATETAPVHAHPEGASPEGCVDMLGNVWEWVESDSRLPMPEKGSAWSLGGSFRHPCRSNTVPCTAIPQDNSYLYLGFRCAADVRVEP